MNYRKPRRSGRISKSVPILLIGSDTEGRVFSEETRAVVLSLHGAGVISRHKLLAEQELVLRSLETGREAEIRVVGEIGANEDAHTYGVAFLDDYLNFWETDFPPPPPPEERPLELFLQCTACGSSVTLLNGDFEFDVCAIHGGLVRYCSDCGFATVWSRPGGAGGAERKPVRRAERPPPRVAQTEKLDSPRENSPLAERLTDERFPLRAEHAPDPEFLRGSESFVIPAARKAATAVEDRRQRVRAKVNYFACVRSAAFDDDVVTCIDMSRGGLGFWTKNAYAISAAVKIAVPYSPDAKGAPAIFVDARVVNIREVPERQMFRCGVMFLPAKGSASRP